MLRNCVYSGLPNKMVDSSHLWFSLIGTEKRLLNSTNVIQFRFRIKILYYRHSHCLNMNGKLRLWLKLLFIGYRPIQFKFRYWTLMNKYFKNDWAITKSQNPIDFLVDFVILSFNATQIRANTYTHPFHKN